MSLRFLYACCVVLSLSGFARAQVAAENVKDLSLLVAPELPCAWPVGMTPFAVVHVRPFGPSPYHRDMIMIDEHCGTQWDAPAHFVPPPDSGLPGAGPTGKITGEKVPAWQFCGEACVIDVTKHVDEAADGESFLIGPEIVQAWEKKNRKLRFGDVVLFRSDYTDRYYKPFPAGERLVIAPLRKKAPGWPAPTPQTMTYLADQGVMTAGLDGASMGPLPNLAVATHQAGGQRGMVWNECSTNLGSLPTTGAFYAQLPAKHAGGSGGECRIVGITEPKLAARLIKSAHAKRVADLSVTLDENYPVTWSGYAPGDEATRYVAKTLNAFDKARGPYLALGHILDGQVGTHVVLPSYSLPAKDFDNSRYAPEVQAALKKYEGKHGRRGTSSITAAQAPLEQMMGEAYVIDVRELAGTTKEADWPASPAITLDLVKQHEKKTRAVRPNDVVLFFSGHSDRHFKPLPAAPELDGVFAAPLAGKAEGWPAPTPEVIEYLVKRGVKCIGTDGPTLGGVNRDDALTLNWLTASRGLLVVEYLTGLEAIADKDAFFIFAPIKIKNTSAGYGRAIALY
jgi:kynurenine formamidase